MRVTRWLPGCFALLLAAAVAIAWMLPPRLDGERFRARLESVAGRVLGTPVRIAGPIHLRLLPQPEMSAGRFAIAAARPDDPSLTADGVRLRLALGPLLVGRIEARSLVLQRPDLRLPPAFVRRALLGRRPGWLAGAAAQIEDGRIETAGLVLGGVNASLSVDPLGGDLTLSGEAAVSGHSWGMTARLSAPGGDGASAIDLALSGLGDLRGVALTLSGQIAADGSMQGRAAARGENLALLLPAPALRFSAEGRVSVAGGLAAADDLAVELGGAASRGALALRFAPALRLDLALAASRLDLDPWAAALRRGGGGAALLAGIPVGIDLSAEAGALGGGTLRGLRAAFDVSPGRIELRDLRATLPGEAALHLTGSVTTSPAMRIEADASLAAPALRTTLGWLAPLLPPLGALPPGALRAADLSAHVVADGSRIVLTRLGGTADGGAVRGNLGWGYGRAVAPAVAGTLSVGSLDLDPWLDSWLASGGAGPALDLQLQSQRATLRGVALSPFRIDLARRDGATELRRVDAGLAGGTAHAAGRISAAGRLDGGRVVVDAPELASVAAVGPPWMAGLLPAAAALWRAPVHLAIDASGTRRALSLRVVGQLGELRAELDPTIDLTSGRWQASIALRHPRARGLLDAADVLPMAGLPSDSAWLGEGSLAAQAECGGGPGGLTIDHLDLAAGALRGGGSLRLAWAAAPEVSGAIDADTLPLPALNRAVADAVLLGGVPRARVNLHVAAGRVTQGGSGLFAPFAADLSLASGRLRLSGMRAGLAGGLVQGEASLDAAAEPPRLQVQGTMQGVAVAGLTGLPVDLASGRASGQATLRAAGHSIAAMLATMQGAADATLDAGSLQGVALDGLPADLPQAAVQRALAGGATRFDHGVADATVQHGVATLGHADLALPDGDLGISGSFDLSQDVADLLLSFRPASVQGGEAAAPLIGLRLVGPAAQAQRVPQLAALARWRTARLQP